MVRLPTPCHSSRELPGPRRTTPIVNPADSGNRAAAPAAIEGQWVSPNTALHETALNPRCPWRDPLGRTTDNRFFQCTLGSNGTLKHAASHTSGSLLPLFSTTTSPLCASLHYRGSYWKPRYWFLWRIWRVLRISWNSRVQQKFKLTWPLLPLLNAFCSLSVSSHSNSRQRFRL